MFIIPVLFLVCSLGPFHLGSPIDVHYREFEAVNRLWLNWASDAAEAGFVMNSHVTTPSKVWRRILISCAKIKR